MACNTAELREKDVISTRDGRRLGFITEFEIDAACGKICAVIISPCVNGFAFGLSRGDVRIPWEKIECIGEDAILVSPGEWSEGCEACRTGGKKKRNSWFW